MSTCNAADLLWDEQIAATFHQLCQEALGRDCLCEGEPCSLMGAALSAVVTTATLVPAT